MTMIPWSKGKALLWDATCVDTFASSHLNISTVNAGAAASEAEVKKQINTGLCLMTTFLLQLEWKLLEC